MIQAENAAIVQDYLSSVGATLLYVGDGNLIAILRHSSRHGHQTICSYDLDHTICHRIIMTGCRPFSERRPLAMFTEPNVRLFYRLTQPTGAERNHLPSAFVRLRCPVWPILRAATEHVTVTVFTVCQTRRAATGDHQVQMSADRSCRRNRCGLALPTASSKSNVLHQTPSDLNALDAILLYKTARSCKATPGG